jgi:hypothetical protein
MTNRKSQTGATQKNISALTEAEIRAILRAADDMFSRLPGEEMV